MHTIHYIAVEAADKQEAFDNVRTLLEPSDEGYRVADWSDWHVVGGGRWSENPNNQYNDSDEDVISHSQNPEKFNEILDKVTEWRVANMKSYMERLDINKFFSDIEEFAAGANMSDKRFDMNRYYVRQAAEMLDCKFNPDSHFFDGKEYTSDMIYLKERLEDPEKAALQFLVPVDFHFQEICMYEQLTLPLNFDTLNIPTIERTQNGSKNQLPL